MLASAVEGAGLAGAFDAVISVDEVSSFKPDGRVYQRALDLLRVPAEAIAFQSSNAWDAYAASDFGFHVVWCNRYGQMRERLPGVPQLLALDPAGRHAAVAAADGKIYLWDLSQRLTSAQPTAILDMGCTVGHSTLPFKEAFPHADVTGIDVAGPQLRYAHARAGGLGLDVGFLQRDASATGLPDASFDLIVSHILLHETSGKAMPAIFRECQLMSCVSQVGGQQFTIQRHVVHN
jgi:hypothetical protein